MNWNKNHSAWLTDPRSEAMAEIINRSNLISDKVKGRKVQSIRKDYYDLKQKGFHLKKPLN